MDRLLHNLVLRGWSARLLRVHSPSKHAFGTCWCQKKTMKQKFEAAKCRAPHPDGTYCMPVQMRGEYVCYSQHWQKKNITESH